MTFFRCVARNLVFLRRTGIAFRFRITTACLYSSTGQIQDVGRDFCLQENWREELKTYPVTSFRGKIYLVRNLDDEQRPFIKRTLQEFSTQTALGFDSEFVCRIKHVKICLIQLASEDKVVIWRVNKMDKESLENSELARILRGKVLKVGHASGQDAMHICKWAGLEVNNVVDTLSWAFKFKCKPKSLQALCFMFLNCRISKSQQQSNWNSQFLTEKQIFYAACDPWISLKLYYEMKRLATQLNIELPKIKSITCPVLEES